ncbi:hypothetical protein HY971_00605 [Candidatus Kaiserbacteria bacterium]|nr:hypothetical protein [Candidatus Kaiserbacteria bacterium]
MAERPNSWIPKIVSSGLGAPKDEVAKPNTLAGGAVQGADAQPAELTDEAMLARDIAYVSANKERVMQMGKRVGEIVRFILDLRDFSEKDETIALRIKNMPRMELADVAAHILDSNELQWQKDPTFYMTIVRHGGARMERLKEIAARPRPTE